MSDKIINLQDRRNAKYMAIVIAETIFTNVGYDEGRSTVNLYYNDEFLKNWELLILNNEDIYAVASEIVESIRSTGIQDTDYEKLYEYILEMLRRKDEIANEIKHQIREKKMRALSFTRNYEDSVRAKEAGQDLSKLVTDEMEKATIAAKEISWRIVKEVIDRRIEMNREISQGKGITRK